MVRISATLRASLPTRSQALGEIPPLAYQAIARGQRMHSGLPPRLAARNGGITIQTGRGDDNSGSQKRRSGLGSSRNGGESGGWALMEVLSLLPIGFTRALARTKRFLKQDCSVSLSRKESMSGGRYCIQSLV